jgi:RNA polymerase sigma-70 factor (ECF subfamily)
MEDGELVARARGGDDGAFGELVRRHELNVRRLATGLLGDPVEAEDAAQEVFLKAYEHMGSFRGDASFSTWIHRIAVNHCRDMLRRRARRPWLSWDGLVEALGREPVSPAARPDQATGRAEAGDVLQRLLRDLPAQHRAVLLLRELNGLSYHEIADVLHISLDAVKARLRRARQAATLWNLQ